MAMVCSQLIPFVPDLTEAKLYVMRVEDDDFESWWDRPLRHVRYLPGE